MSDTELMDERNAEPMAAEPFRRPLIYTGGDLEFPIHAQNGYLQLSRSSHEDDKRNHRRRQ